MRLILSVVLSLFLVGCLTQSVEKAGLEVVKILNTKDYGKLWDQYIDEGTKVEIDLIMDNAKKSQNSDLLVMTKIGIPEEDLESVTPKEYFMQLWKFSVDLGSKGQDVEQSTIVYKNVKMIDKDNAAILSDNDFLSNKLYLVKIEGKWYLNMESR